MHTLFIPVMTKNSRKKKVKKKINRAFISNERRHYLKGGVVFLPAHKTTMCQNPSQESFMSLQEENLLQKINLVIFLLTDFQVKAHHETIIPMQDTSLRR